MENRQGTSAKWSSQLDREFLDIYAQAAGKPHYVASGGKSLKASGWQWVLAKMKERNDIGNIREVEQLKSRWRHLKEDYIDYHWLTVQHSVGGRAGMTSDQWNELDKTGRKHKLSRFRFEDFPYYDIMQSIVGDTMATGEFIRGSQDIRTSSLVARVFPTIE
ncbi:hypothetical protein AC1031_011382 [Aphanomyces cochlioides]|nr:hypothetical protein AC1031_011382 [Aphanomyces cochlioides]